MEMNDGEAARHVPWPFPGGSFPGDLGAVVQRTVLNGELPAGLVIHDDENDWCVGDDVNDPKVPGASVIVHMTHVLAGDSSVSELASLPPEVSGLDGRGWRPAPGRPPDPRGALQGPGPGHHVVRLVTACQPLRTDRAAHSCQPPVPESPVG